MINFSQIPALALVPGNYVEFDTSRMMSGLPVAKTRTLIVGQKLASGTMTALVLYKVNSANQAKVLAGQGSMLADMVDGYFRRTPIQEVWIMGVADNGAGALAAGTFIMTGPSTAAGTASLMVADQSVQVPVASGVASTAVATAIAAAINAYPDLPVTATAASSTVTVTARHKGLESNGLFLGVNYHDGETTPAGLTITPTSLSAGTTNPDATTVIAALGDERFASIIHPWTDATNLAVFEAACLARANALEMNYSEAYAFKNDTYSNLITLASARNSAFQPVAGMYRSPTPAWKLAAMMVAAIDNWVSTSLGCPYKGLVLVGALAPMRADRFPRDEREFLLEAGCATVKVDANENVVLERMVTTYKTNAQGYVDAGLRDLNAILLLYYLSWSQQARIAVRFPNYKAGDDDGVYLPGTSVATPKTIKGELAALATEWAQAGLIENLQAYIDSLDVQRNAGDRDRFDSFQRPDLINEFNTLASLFQPIS